MSNLRAIEYDVTATVTFKDVTWVSGFERSQQVTELSGLSVVDTWKIILTEELEILAKSGDYRVEVEVGAPRDVTDQFEDAIKAED